MSEFKETLSELFNLQGNKFFRTIRGLTIAPGDTIRAFAAGDRKSFLHPFTYALTLIGISLFLGNFATADHSNQLIIDVQNKTEHNTGIQINLAFNYSAREEIIEAVKQIVANKKRANKFESYLYSDGVPDPDLIIRTGGELRLSDFLLWQSAYSELIFTKKLWPDFKFIHLKMSIKKYLKRKKNYGK